MPFREKLLPLPTESLARLPEPSSKSHLCISESCEGVSSPETKNADAGIMLLLVFGPSQENSNPCGPPPWKNSILKS